MTEIDVPDWVALLAEDRYSEAYYKGMTRTESMKASLTAALGAWVAPVAWAMTDHQADGPMTILTTNREDAKFWGEQGIDVEPLYKSPQPSADAVRELVARWRDKAKRTDAEDRADDALEFCADELEAALTREAPTEVVGGVIVPRDPTLDMLNAGWREIERQGLDPESVEMLPIYHAMVTATPPAPQQQSAEKECTCKAGEGCTDSCSRGWRRILSEAGQLPPSSRQSVLDFICREMEKLGAPQRQSAKEVAIVCDWKDADPFPRFIEAEVDGCSVSLEWRDREDGLRELIVPAHTQSDYPGCSGDPASCPENEGYGCCKPNPPRLAQGEDDRAAAILSDVLGIDAGRIAWGRGEGCTVSLDDALTAVNMALTTQPPHQDRGEVNLDQVDAALFCTPVTDDGDELAMPIDCMNMGTPEQLPLARTIMRAALTAALTEAKQQDTDWRAFPYSNAWCDGLAACLRECGEHEAARQIDDIKRFVSDAVEAKQQGPGEVLARGWFHALPEDDYEFHDDASGAGKHCPGCIRAMIVAAPAASGGDVWTREMVADAHKRGEELFQRINPPSAAPP